MILVRPSDPRMRLLRRRQNLDAPLAITPTCKGYGFHFTLPQDTPTAAVPAASAIGPASCIGCKVGNLYGPQSCYAPHCPNPRR